MDITTAWFEFLGTLGALCKPVLNLLIASLSLTAASAFLLHVPKQKRNAAASPRITA